MTAITLKKVPDELHRLIKRLQLDYEDAGKKMSLEEIYIDLIRLGLAEVEKKKK